MFDSLKLFQTSLIDQLLIKCTRKAYVAHTSRPRQGKWVTGKNWVVMSVGESEASPRASSAPLSCLPDVPAGACGVAKSPAQQWYVRAAGETTMTTTSHQRIGSRFPYYVWPQTLVAVFPCTQGVESPNNGSLFRGMDGNGSLLRNMRYRNSILERDRFNGLTCRRGIGRAMHPSPPCVLSQFRPQRSAGLFLYLSRQPVLVRRPYDHGKQAGMLADQHRTDSWTAVARGGSPDTRTLPRSWHFARLATPPAFFCAASHLQPSHAAPPQPHTPRSAQLPLGA